MDQDELNNRFTYHKPDEAKAFAHDVVRETCRMVSQQFNALLPDSREKSRAMTALEDVMMNANAAIARNPLPPDGENF